MSKQSRSLRSALALLLAVGAYLLFGSTEMLSSFLGEQVAPPPGASASPPPGASASPPPDAFASRTDTGAGEAAIEAAIENRRSGFMVDVSGVVKKRLSDDNEGSRHQRFIVRLPRGNTILVAHNIDLAPRVPLDEGDSLRMRGQYEWNERGGVLHWTHHDPNGSHPGGWIELDGRTYE